MPLVVIAVKVVSATWKAFVVYTVIRHKMEDRVLVIPVLKHLMMDDDGRKVFQPTWQGKDRQSSFHLLQLSPAMIPQSGTDVISEPSNIGSLDVQEGIRGREERRGRNAINESCQIRL